MAFEGFIRAVRMDWGNVRDRSVYPFSIPAVAALDRSQLELDPRVTFLVGENGSGKSTLLEAIAILCDMNAEGGSRHARFGTRRSESELPRHLRLIRSGLRPASDFFLRAETFYNVATYVDDEIGTGGYGDVGLHDQSHGESFIALALNRFHPGGLYLLDEPEAALSPQSQLVLLARLHELAELQSQIVIATHSPILLALPGATIYELSENGFTRTSYDDLELVRLYRDFVEDPQLFLRYLLDESAD
jgi:predicted ATPase